MWFVQVFLRNTGTAKNSYEWQSHYWPQWRVSIKGTLKRKVPMKWELPETNKKTQAYNDEEFPSRELWRSQFPWNGNSHVKTTTVQRRSRDSVSDSQREQSEDQTVTLHPTVRLIQEVDLVQTKVTCEESTTWASSKGHFGHKRKMRLPKHTWSIKPNE